MARPTLHPDMLAAFIQFVRMNPTIAADDPMMTRTFEAYRKSNRAYLKAVADHEARVTATTQPSA